MHNYELNCKNGCKLFNNFIPEKPLLLSFLQQNLNIKSINIKHKSMICMKEK